jgi:hypothetical protein
MRIWCIEQSISRYTLGVLASNGLVNALVHATRYRPNLGRGDNQARSTGNELMKAFSIIVWCCSDNEERHFLLVDF